MADNSMVLEAAKLLKDFQDEAWKSVFGTLKSEDNTISFDGFVMSHVGTLSMVDKGHWHLKMKINGKEHDLKGTFERGFRPEEAASSMLAAMLKEIEGTLKQYLTPKLTEALNPRR